MLKSVRRSVLAAILLYYFHVSGADYGVGFELSLDYGVTSVYFSNGSAVDIAKIAGSPNYRQMMRTAYMADALMFQKGFRDYLPPWLGGKRPGVQPLVPMLEALKTAAESYLETIVSAAEIVVPFPVTEDYREALRSASSSVSLQIPNSAQPPAGIVAAQAYGIGRKPCYDSSEDDPPQLILTVEYTRAALTALLVHEECKVYEYRRILHDTNLGLDQLHGGSEANREKLEASLRKLISLPLNDGGNGDGLKYLNNLVLLGESADNSQLHDILKNILSEQYGRFIATAGESGSSAIDPLFAASRGVAADCWDRLNFKDDSIRYHHDGLV